MAASQEPGEDEISQVIDFANLNPEDDRSMVIQALKDNGGNVESVVMQYFDNPATFRQKFARLWNESMFSADRDGSDNQTGISFHIESMGQNDVILGVTPPPERGGPGAPSRPPSRSNTRSPLGAMVDWTAGGDTAGGSSTHSKEDQDMQRALRESAQEAGIALPHQESGVLDPTTSMPYFGPANRNEYDQDSWAMVPSESKVAAAPTPEMRRRAPGAPAFLVQGVSSAGQHCLGGLLTILHEIPLSRNLLLFSGVPAESYGYNSEWWKGQEILAPQVLAKLQSGEIQWGERHGVSPNFEEEIHRLMAFLDSTERSYGAVSVLTDLIPFSSVGPEKRLFEHLIQQQAALMMPLTQVATLSQVLSDEEGEEEARFGLLEIEHPRVDYVNIKTLYESLDHVMWSDVLSWGEIHEGSNMAMFKNMGDVFIMKISGDGPQDSIEIPQVLYPEKYLVSRKDEARRIQRGWCETKRAMHGVAQSEQELFEWKNDWNSQMGDKREMLRRVVGQWEAYREYLETRGRFRGMEESGFDTDRYPDYRAAPCKMDGEESAHHRVVQDVLVLAEEALADIDNKLEALNKNMEQIRSKQRFLGNLLTEPEKPGRPKPMTCKKYLLRGVATPNDVVYLCQRSEADSSELEGGSPPYDQWWRLAYSPKDDQPVEAEKIEIERVFRDVWQETKTPLFVYATESALNTARAPLPAPLERFVRAENKAFRQELGREQADGAPAADVRGTLTMEAISPSKRKHRADSADSMDSNRASLGSDDRNGFDDDPFLEDGPVTATEMADLSDRRRVAAPNQQSNGGAEPATAEGGGATAPLPNRQARETDRTRDGVLAERGASAAAHESPSPNEEAEAPARAPEMQERARPLTFMAASASKSQSNGQANTIDMELPDYQE
ncbi:hypothetical protein CDD83_3526 [Cordyceps sp. RAO-2017]|nr:hypothetical protein CDD83_3526 [Cordyceps sp. RAO-2017]